MRKEREILFRKIEEVQREELAEYELSCGFFTSEIAKEFKTRYNDLYDELAATYGLSTEDYFRKEHDIACSIPNQLPFM